jgi:hypothetical protein
MSKTHTVELTLREIVLLRCGLLKRMDNLRTRHEPACQRSYEDSRQLMIKLWPYVAHARPEEVL